MKKSLMEKIDAMVLTALAGKEGKTTKIYLLPHEEKDVRTYINRLEKSISSIHYGLKMGIKDNYIFIRNSPDYYFLTVDGELVAQNLEYEVALKISTLIKCKNFASMARQTEDNSEMLDILCNKKELFRKAA